MNTSLQIKTSPATTFSLILMRWPGSSKLRKRRRIRQLYAAL